MQKKCYMKKTICKISILLVLVVSLTSGVKELNHASNISGNTTGCSCHGTSTTSATNIFITGIPANTIAGQKYAMSLTIASVGGKVWGFDMGVPTSMGVFTTTNPNAKATTSGKEIRHYNGAPTLLGNSYTFDSIFWTAPATAGSVKFSYAGLAGNGNGGSGGDKAYKSTFTTTVSVPTPLKLISFTAKSEATNSVLNWITNNEVNTSHFAIEKSIDETNFIEVGTVNAKGNTTASTTYSFVDNKPSVFNKPVYYRLKMVDKDGAAKYSNVEQVVIKQTKSFDVSVYPNPVKSGESMKLKLNSTVFGKASITIINYNGKIVSSKNISINNGSNLIELSTRFMSAGTYSILVSNEKDMMQVPVIVE